MTISTLADRVLCDHAKNPVRLYYDVNVLGSLFLSGALASLDSAYAELVSHGLMEFTGQAVRFFGEAKNVFRITEAGLKLSGFAVGCITMFLDGVIHQLGAFAIAKNVEPKDVFVRLFLEDGEIAFCHDLKTLGPYAGSDWGMIFGMDRGAEIALVFRESHVIRVQFELEPEVTGSIGFIAESNTKLL